MSHASPRSCRLVFRSRLRKRPGKEPVRSWAIRETKYFVEWKAGVTELRSRQVGTLVVAVCHQHGVDVGHGIDQDRPVEVAKRRVDHHRRAPAVGEDTSHAEPPRLGCVRCLYRFGPERRAALQPLVLDMESLQYEVFEAPTCM